MIYSQRLKFICLIVSSITSTIAFGQNIFPQKVEGCDTHTFCLDCGDPRATCDSLALSNISEKINKKYNLAGARGGIALQVLVDSVGNGCVISHTDTRNSPISTELVKYLNECKWIPGRENNKTTNSSINVIFEIKDGKLWGHIEHIDMKALNENMKNPGEPDIFNKTYTYDNPSLKNYEITIWQKENSGLPQDMSQNSVIDKSGQVWYATLNGLAKFDGSNFIRIDEKNSPFKSTATISALAVDKDDNKWFDTDNAIYRFDNKTWQKFDSTKIVIAGANHIIPNNDEIFFCGEKGLAILKNGQWSFIDKKVIKQLPANRIFYAFRDQKQRLWIGTVKGSIMVDAQNNITEFNSTETPLKNICISGSVTDENGNIYFIPYAYDHSSRDSEEEGLIILSNDGKWSHLNDKNSGLPANTINSLLYDKFEKILWIGTNTAGLVRYDLKNGWEDYHNQNSKVPSVYIFNMSQNSKGEIYVSTYDGMMRIRRR